MPKPEKGVRYGGRQKGTPNKATASIREAVDNVLGDYMNSGLMLKDFEGLNSQKERLEIAIKLMQFVAPKMKSVDVAVSSDQQLENVAQRLARLGDGSSE